MSYREASSMPLPRCLLYPYYTEGV